MNRHLFILLFLTCLASSPRLHAPNESPTATETPTASASPHPAPDSSLSWSTIKNAIIGGVLSTAAGTTLFVFRRKCLETLQTCYVRRKQKIVDKATASLNPNKLIVAIEEAVATRIRETSNRLVSPCGETDCYSNSREPFIIASNKLEIAALRGIRGVVLIYGNFDRLHDHFGVQSASRETIATTTEILATNDIPFLIIHIQENLPRSRRNVCYPTLMLRCTHSYQTRNEKEAHHINEGQTISQIEAAMQAVQTKVREWTGQFLEATNSATPPLAQAVREHTANFLDLIYPPPTEAQAPIPTETLSIQVQPNPLVPTEYEQKIAL